MSNIDELKIISTIISTIFVFLISLFISTVFRKCIRRRETLEKSPNATKESHRNW